MRSLLVLLRRTATMLVQVQSQHNEVRNFLKTKKYYNLCTGGAPTKGSDKLQEPTVTLPGMVAGDNGEDSTDTESIAPENPG